MKSGFHLLFILLLSFSCTSKKENNSSLNYAERPVREPMLLAEGIISTREANEFDLTFSPNGRSIFFTRRKGDEKQKIWFSRFENQSWTQPEVASFSNNRDETPFLTPDGKTLFFGSERPIPGTNSKGNFDMNIWKTRLVDGKWAEPEALDSTINKIQVDGEQWPSSNENMIYSVDGEEFYYSSMMRGSKTIDIYSTRLNGETFSKPKKITGLFEDPKYWKYGAILSPDGNYLFFNSYEAPGGLGGDDIFVAKRTPTGWSAAVNLGEPVNSQAEEGSPRFSKDGKYFFFARDSRIDPEEDGIWSIYFMEAAYLKLDELFTD